MTTRLAALEAWLTSEQSRGDTLNDCIRQIHDFHEEGNHGIREFLVSVTGYEYLNSDEDN